MADPFNPKFVDLVRNYTTSTGTGSFTLGTAVNGFTGIASALGVGDQFYYSCIGVDKPAEREVGRGTLLAGGKVSRQPINGTLTNFSIGTKAIALVAAAEWFEGIAANQAAPSGGTSVPLAADLAALAALDASKAGTAFLQQEGRAGNFTWDASDLSAEVAADSAQGIYVAPNSDVTGASGAWVRVVQTPAVPEWFGAAGDGTTDDSAELQAWLDRGGDLRLPGRTYRSSATLIVRKLVNILGVGSNWTATAGSVIKFDAGVAGFDVQPATALTDCAAVIAAGAGAFTQQGAFNSTFNDFALVGQGGAAATAFYCRTYVHAANLVCWNFSGKGFDLSASGDAGDGNSEYGNMSNSAFNDCGAYECGSHALNVRGRDANTMNFSNFTAFSCGGWGILNESVIGNQFIKPNIATNALGAIRIPGASASVIDTPFIEIGSGSNCEINASCTVIGVNLGAANNADLTSYAVEPSVHRTRFVGFYAPEALSVEDNRIYKWDGLYLQGMGSTRDVSLVNKDGTVVAYVQAGSTNFQVPGTLVAGNIQATGTLFANVFQSRGANQGSWPGVADGYFAILPFATHGVTIGGYGTIYDASLFNRNGAFVFGVAANSLNVAAAGDITSFGGKLGYSPGAGGTVTQATSKTTGVTLDKVCGAVTMNNAALAANATAVFTLTNSKIAADDDVRLWVKSGNATAATYRAWSEGNAAGSRKVVLQNISAGSLSEAVVLGFLVIKGAIA